MLLARSHPHTSPLYAWAPAGPCVVLAHPARTRTIAMLIRALIRTSGGSVVVPLRPVRRSNHTNTVPVRCVGYFDGAGAADREARYREMLTRVDNPLPDPYHGEAMSDIVEEIRAAYGRVGITLDRPATYGTYYR